MDALNARNKEDTLELQDRSAEVEEKVWKKMNQATCGVIRSYLEGDLNYDVMNKTSAEKIWETLASKYLVKNIKIACT